MGILEAIRSRLGLTAGQFWPPASETNRLRAYERYRAIFDGFHADALDEQDIASLYGTYITCNVAKNIATIPADILFGEEIGFEYPEDVDDEQRQTIEEIFERTKLQTLLYESAIDNGIYGDSVLAVERDEDGLAAFRSIPVSTWFPELDPDDIRKELAHVIAWKRTVLDGDHERYFLRMIRHERGRIENLLYRMSQDGKLEGEANSREWALLYPDGAPEATIDTGVEDDFVLVHIPNFRTSTTYHGHGEYFDLESMFAAVDALFTQSAHVLAKHTDPMLGLPHDVYVALRGKPGSMPVFTNPKTREKTVGMIDKKLLDVVSMGPNGEKPEYIIWDGKLSDNLALIDSLIDKIALVSETAPQLLNRGEWGADISGRALQILLVRTLAKVNRKRQYYNAAIPRLLVIAQRLQGVDDPVTVTVRWQDGLPQDMMATIEAESAKLRERVQSRLGAIQAIYDIDKTAAEKKLEEINAEEDVDRNNDVLNNMLGRRRDPGLGQPGDNGANRMNPIEVRLG